MWTQAARQKSKDLIERAKELNCIYQIDEACKNLDASQDEIFLEILKIIPPGWQFPDICRAKIIYKDKEFKFQPFAESQIFQSADLYESDDKVGSLVVYYLEPNDVDYGNKPFLNEEQKLLNTIASRVNNYLFHKVLKETFGKWDRAQDTIKVLQADNNRLLKILTNADLDKVLNYLQSPSKEVLSPEDLEAILAPKSNKHWEWRFEVIKDIANKIKNHKAEFALTKLYYISPKDERETGADTMIQIIVASSGSEKEKCSLSAWFDGWSQCLSLVNLQKTSYHTKALIDLYVLDDEGFDLGSDEIKKISGGQELTEIII
jgi:hypothetical protein